jgi:hypothetical protein
MLRSYEQQLAGGDLKKPRPSRYARHRFSAEVISLAVGLYFCFRPYLEILAEAGHRPDWLPEIKGLEPPP